MKLNTVLLTLFILLCCPVQNFAIGKSDNIHFYNLNEEYGISMFETNQACSDADGFIWISSKMGILRYTQDDIRTYQLPYESGNVISVQLNYKDGRLYAYSNNGQVFKYNTIQDKFELVVNVSKELRNPYLVVTKMLIDFEGQMWFASSFGLFYYNTETGLKNFVQNQDVHFIEWMDSTHFFITLKGAIRVFNITTLTAEEYYQFSNGTNYVAAAVFYEQKDNTLWIGTDAGGLLKLSNRNGIKNLDFVPGIPNQPILAIESIDDSTLLVGIDGQGVWDVNKNTNKINAVYKEDSDQPGSLKGNGVYDIFCDQNKRVWICTYSGGVSFFDLKSSMVTKVSHVVNNPNSLVNDDINSILEDSDGNIWLATNNGVSCWDSKTNRWRSFFHNNKDQAQVFLTLCEDDRGRIWAGTYSSGVYLLERSTGRQLAHYCVENQGKAFACNFVFDIIKDSRGDIWVGGVRGDLVCYHPKQDRFTSFDNYTVYVMEEYGADKLLIGTTYGLLLFDKSSGTSETLIEGFQVYDICLKNNVVWVGTSGDGVIRYEMNSKAMERFSADSGLPSNFVNSIEYADGYFWIGTEQGMCRLDEARHTVSTFNSIFDLSHAAFNQNSHAILKNGKLMMGTNMGAIMFEPHSLQPGRQEEGRIYIQDLSVSGRSIREIDDLSPQIPIDSLSNISLKYFQNTISLELIPIGVNSPGSKFSWRMEGLDQQWSKPGNNRILSYSNIPNGTYALYIRMFDSSMTSVIAERSIVLKMIPPFWETAWFRILVFTFLIGLGIFTLAFYIDRLKKQHSEEKIRFFANTAHDIRTSLTLIKGPIEELNKEPGLTNKGLQYLHLATEQTHRLSKVVTQLMDFQKADVGKERLTLAKVDIVKLIESRVMMFDAYAKTKNIELKFSSNLANFETAVDEVMIEKVIDNLVSNAIKYSFPDVPVNVNFQVASNKWFLEVLDQGIGISKKAQRQLFNEYYRGDNAVNSKIVGSGIGLLLVKNYVNLHGGKVSCFSQQNVGSSFHVSIPVNNSVEELAVDRKGENISLTKATPLLAQSNTIMMSEVKASHKHRLKIMIVEDHEYLREFLRSAMDEEFHVDLAEDGQQAWEMVQKGSPDLIVSDIMMPRMDGFALCEKLKSTYETSHIPIILLTALSNKTQHLKGLGLGADDYLTKPFDVTLLQQRIKSIIQNRELVREKALKIIKQSDGDEAILDNGLNDKFLKRMGEIVRENIANSEFSKDDFATAMNVSSSLLYKKIKSLTNQSPTDFIKAIRLDHSLDLIQSRKYTITEVSELCGFSSVGYFSTVFRKHYGKSPTQIV
ncbi:two-component regulator propeller domain-containing protein [Mangrovibacterium sp.]|uniref:hybrid sensor histidine kinase/response regulator transcription factor n=1 Tax=Mangrovibacterium sp. TaxID=1961364 RepID=UPI003567D444